MRHKNMKYPKITKENFEEMTDKLVIEAKMWRPKDKYYDRFKVLDIEAPRNAKEFAEATKALYGVKLTVDCRAYPLGAFSNYKYATEYEIQEKQDEYSKGEIYQLWDKKYSQYDGLRPLLNLTFGELFCGGVAGAHYGQAKCNKKTWDRIRKWDKFNDLKNLKGAIKQHNSMIEIFGTDPFMR